MRSHGPNGPNSADWGHSFAVPLGHSFPTPRAVGPSFLGLSLLLGLVCAAMPEHSSSSSPSPSFPNSTAVASFSSLSLTLAQKSLHENFYDQKFDERNAFETARYGLRIDHCPNGENPEVSEQDGRIKLCQLDAECKPSFKCENIVGLTHFGKQMRYCCPTKISVCTLKPKLATDVWSFPAGCHRPPLRTFYYFDADLQKCAKGRMAQCEEFGENQFATESECRTKCETTACELGESLLLHNNSFDSPFLCSSDDDCPVGYNCRQDHIFRRSVCCGFLNFEPCPLGFRSFAIPFTGRAKLCKDSATRDECPADYVCTQNAISKQQFCCTVEKGVCPQGHQAYIHPLTDGTIKCNLRSFDATTSCPTGYVCLEAVFDSIWGFCCAQAMTANCPEGSYPQINLITKQPQRCELTQRPSVCTSEFECETEEATHLGFCCSIRKHEKVKPTPEPMPRKRTKTMPTQNATMTTTTLTLETIGTTNSMEVMALSTAEMGGEMSRKGEGRQRKKGKWKGKKSRKRGRQRESGRKDEENDHSSFSSTTSSDEQSEKADLIELSTKLDRFISGVRRRAKLPKGHARGRPRGRNANKDYIKWGTNIGRVSGKRKHGRRWTDRVEGGKGEKEGEGRMGRKREWEENGGEEGEEEEELPDESTLWKHKKSGESIKIPKCPHGFRAMNYPGTQWTYLECVMDEELKLRKRRRKTKKRKQNGGRKRRRKKRKDRMRMEWEEEREEEEEREQVGGGEEDEGGNSEAGEEEEETSEQQQQGGPAEHDLRRRSTVCPRGSMCLNARDDPFGRALCCMKRRRKLVEEYTLEREENGQAEDRGTLWREEGEERVESDNKHGRTAATETASTKTAIVPLALEGSADRACPRLVTGRICKPGSMDTCVEEGFFCQYNKERKEFVCCTLQEVNNETEHVEREGRKMKAKRNTQHP